MHVIKSFNSLQLDKDCTFNQQIRDIFTNNNFIILYLDPALLLDTQSVFVELMVKSILINLFEKSATKLAGHSI